MASTPAPSRRAPVEAKTQAARGEALIGRADDEDEEEAPAAAPEATEEA